MNLWKRFRRVLVPVGAVALLIPAIGAISGSASATTSTTPLTTALSVDCDSPPAEEIYWVVSTGSASISITNCPTYEVIDGDYNVIENDSGNPGSTVVPAAHELVVYDIFGDPIWSAWFNPVYPETRPSGQLLLARTLGLPADAPEFFAGPPNRPDIDDDEHFLGGIEDCDLESDPGKGMHVYATFAVRVLVAGQYTFRGIGTDPLSEYLSSLNPENDISDPFLALYTDFDPTSPDDNVVGCNDDLNNFYDDYGDEMGEQLAGGVVMEGHQPYFTAFLQPGIHTLVLTLYGEVEGPNWWTNQAPASVDFEMWGPVDGLCDTADPACTAIDPDPVNPVFTG